MYNIIKNTNGTLKEKNNVILPTNDLNFKRIFASPENIKIIRGFLQDLAAYDPLGQLQIAEIKIETPYNFQDVNRLSSVHEDGMMLTEVDYACYDEDGIRFVLEMQKRDLNYLEERMFYNVGQKFGQLYAGDSDPKKSKYVSLRPVVAIVILEENHFKDDTAIHFFRPYDVRFGAYKKNLALGLEIYVELNKDISRLPKNLQFWFQYFRTGFVPEEAPYYLQEAAKMVETTSLTKEERDFADRLERAQQTYLLAVNTAQMKAEAFEQKKEAAEQKMAAEKKEMAVKKQEIIVKEQEIMVKEQEIVTKEQEIERKLNEVQLKAKSNTDKMLEVARASLASGLDIELIASITGLDENTIKNLK